MASLKCHVSRIQLVVDSLKEQLRPINWLWHADQLVTSIEQPVVFVY